MSDILEVCRLDEHELAEVARRFAAAVGDGGVIFLEGDLGAGKTTFARALLGALGVGERIKSPTYSLVESYQVGALRAHHLDLYRIAHTEELEWLGLSDLLDASTLLLVEWPQRGQSALPPADLNIELRHAGERRDFKAGALSVRGREWLQRVSELRVAGWINS